MSSSLRTPSFSSISSRRSNKPARARSATVVVEDPPPEDEQCCTGSYICLGVYAAFWTLVRAFFVAGAIAQLAFDYHLVYDGTELNTHWLLTFAVTLFIASVLELIVTTAFPNAALFLCTAVFEHFVLLIFVGIFIYATYFEAILDRSPVLQDFTDVFISTRLIGCLFGAAIFLLVFAPFPAMLFDAYRNEKWYKLTSGRRFTKKTRS
ncbi:hypothetical protein AAVH_11735 [Aphelenchoides avenae]|nr:hypothetical protein AAVH_11735 [Aphelenchus avenae]